MRVVFVVCVCGVLASLGSLLARLGRRVAPLGPFFALLRRLLALLEPLLVPLGRLLAPLDPLVAPPADIVYVLAFSKVLYKLNCCLTDKGLCSFLDAHRHDASLVASDADYCDDIVFPVISPAGQLIDKVTDASPHYLIC